MPLYKYLSFLSIVFGAHSSLIPVDNIIPLINPRPGVFSLKDNIVGHAFYSYFDWETFNDPTHGRVNYVDKHTAISRNLTFATDNSFIMRADDRNVVKSNSRGRDSNRIRSYSTFQDSVLVLDLQHMPHGCGTWPAFWTVTTGGWPDGGEIDIIEGVNNDYTNLVSLHTSPGCSMAPNRDQSGTTRSTDCNAYASNNQGCGTSLTKRNSYGVSLNENKGGWYVMKRTQNDGVYVWYFPRDDPTVPDEIRTGNPHIKPDEVNYGKPDARFPSSQSCNFKSHFGEHEIVFDLTFCGDWAGSTFAGSGCGRSCQEYVDQNPQAFADAYWEIKALRVYTPESSLLSLPSLL